MRTIKSLYDYVIISLGCAITAVGIGTILAPNHITAGGISGLATAVGYISNMKIGTLTLLFNIPIFITGFYFEGKNFIGKTIFATIALSAFLDLFENTFIVTSNVLLAAIFGGMVSGVGMGIIFRCNATTGGTDVVAKVLRRAFPYVSLGNMILFVDICIIAIAGLIFRNIESALLSILALFIMIKTIDLFIEGFDYAKAVLVISDKYDSLKTVVLNDIDRGCTLLSGYGGYTGKDKNIIMCILRNREIPKLKRIIAEYDMEAFVIVFDVREINGKGFS